MCRLLNLSKKEMKQLKRLGLEDYPLVDLKKIVIPITSPVYGDLFRKILLTNVLLGLSNTLAANRNGDKVTIRGTEDVASLTITKGNTPKKVTTSFLGDGIVSINDLVNTSTTTIRYGAKWPNGGNIQHIKVDGRKIAVYDYDMVGSLRTFSKDGIIVKEVSKSGKPESRSVTTKVTNPHLGIDIKTITESPTEVATYYHESDLTTISHRKDSFSDFTSYETSKGYHSSITIENGKTSWEDSDGNWYEHSQLGYSNSDGVVLTGEYSYDSSYTDSDGIIVIVKDAKTKKLVSAYQRSEQIVVVLDDMSLPLQLGSLDPKFHNSKKEMGLAKIIADETEDGDLDDDEFDSALSAAITGEV